MITETLFLRHRLIAQLFRNYYKIAGISTIKIEMQTFANLVKAEIVQRTGANLNVGAIIATNNGCVVVGSTRYGEGDVELREEMFDILGTIALVEKTIPTEGAIVTFVPPTVTDANAVKAKTVERASGTLDESFSKIYSENAVALLWDTTASLSPGGVVEVSSPSLRGVMEIVEGMIEKEGVLLFSIGIDASPATATGEGIEGVMLLTDETGGSGRMSISHKYTTEKTESGGTAYYITSDYRLTSGNTVYIGGKYADQ